MKKMMTILLGASLVITSCSKQSHGGDDLFPHQPGVEDNNHGGNGAVVVPAAVLSAFMTRYPNATRIEWKQESNGNFKAEFFRGTVKWEATFSRTGVLVKEEHN